MKPIILLLFLMQLKCKRSGVLVSKKLRRNSVISGKCILMHIQIRSRIQHIQDTSSCPFQEYPFCIVLAQRNQNKYRKEIENDPRSSYFCHGFDLQWDIIAKKDELSIVLNPPEKDCTFKDMVFSCWRNNFQ